MEKSDLKQLPVRENHNCFGCSPTNASGLRMCFYTDGEALFSWLSVPAHLSGWRNLVHGGVITTILDEIMGWSAIYLLKCLVLTKSISIDFIKPLHIGDNLRAEGRLVKRKHEREAMMKGFLYDGDNNLCARSIGAFALFPPDMASKLGMMDETIRDDFERIISS